MKRLNAYRCLTIAFTTMAVVLLLIAGILFGRGQRLREYYHAGRGALLAQNYRTAIHNFGMVVKLRASEEMAWCGLALAYFHAGDYQRSLEAFAEMRIAAGSDWDQETEVAYNAIVSHIRTLARGGEPQRPTPPLLEFRAPEAARREPADSQ